VNMFIATTIRALREVAISHLIYTLQALWVNTSSGTFTAGTAFTHSSLVPKSSLMDCLTTNWKKYMWIHPRHFYLQIQVQ